MRIFWYRATSILRYVLIAVVLMGVISQISSFDIPRYTLYSYAALVGFFMGVYYVLFGFNFIKRLPFLIRLLFQLLILQLVITVAVVSVLFVQHSFGIRPQVDFSVFGLLSPELLTLYYKSQFYTFLLLFFFELEIILGRGFLFNYIRGKYDKPRKERRIFMFLDLIGSTEIAEKIGDDDYYDFLNECYQLLNRPVINTRAEILKYVGDEVIITWPYSAGLKHNNAVEFFYQFKEALKLREGFFTKKYNTFPRFKAGLHEGVVLIAYIGDLKKQLDLSGDAMNTTSRIAGMCREHQAEFLVSAQLYDAIPEKKYQTRRIADVKLKGKSDKIDLIELSLPESEQIPK